MNYKIWPFLFQSNKNPMFKKLRITIFVLIIYSIIVVLAQTHFDAIFDWMQLGNLGRFHLIFSFVISILIAFRVNSSYARWWEGRGYWGSLVNDSRNIALKFNNFIGLKNDPLFTKCLEHFPQALKFHLRNQDNHVKETLIEIGLTFTPNDHLPSVVINYLYKRINYYRINKVISLEQYLSLDAHLTNIIDVVGGCEKIVKTRIPAPFKIFINQALHFYMVVFPFGWAETFGLLIIPIIIVFVYILQGMEILAEDMEDPFEEDYQGHSNNLPLDAIAEAIANNISSIAAFESQ